MLSYSPGESLGHRLDPRTKLAFQAVVAGVALAHTTPAWLLALTAVCWAALAGCRLPIRETLAEYRGVLPFLVVAPLLEALRVGPPWLELEAAVDPALALYRTLLLLALAAAYVKTTSPRESRAAVVSVVPGRPGRYLGLGVALVFRYLPLLQADVRRLREAAWARLGDERRVDERVAHLAVGGLERAFDRADALSLAMRARCLSWNATAPALAFTRGDYAVLCVAGALVAAGLVW
ncbi:energy-coupling factor transporter transmembrane protein EcfT [Halarchaeum sp. CBA1220]|uniref:energy-coupling factor transporter transmembrane component T family protein n=1 Tax=Halarchaeum sp. CBA1220 TaxID=1853682 RepID=UPI000F3A94A4|nr:energy-coupling factor transporter transmembrane component T [Halarchaeum sp. CBA1220]QLC33485.1 energy-coupling factor transporter transmembrane protein EcfT [Halarchaeum sp. CBA1220]